jgi:DivIVA domain-containing protein
MRCRVSAGSVIAVTPEDVRTATFNSAVWSGYARSEVEGLLQRVAIQLEARQSPAATIAQAQLPRVRGGYTVSEVDDFLAELQSLDPNSPQPTPAPSGPVVDRTMLLRPAAVIVIGTATALAGGAAIASTILVFALLAVQPIAGWHRYRRLIYLVRRDRTARARHYVGGMISAWSYIPVIALIGAVADRGPKSIGLTTHAVDASAAAASWTWIITAAVTLVISILILRRAGPKLIARLRRQLRRLAPLLPHTPRERVLFAGVAVTAGICEEVLYRGFGISYLRWLDPGISHAGIIMIIGAAFGLAHLYQGPRNVVLTGLAGAWLTWITLYTGTLLPAIVLHFLVDFRICFLPPKLTDQAGWPTSSS